MATPLSTGASVVLTTLLQTAEPPPLSAAMLVVFAIIAVALVLFVWELTPSVFPDSDTVPGRFIPLS